MFRFSTGNLREQAGGAEGGGTGGTGTGEPKPLTKDEIALMVKTQLDAFSKKWMTDLGAQMGELTKPLLEKIEGLAAAGAGDGKGGDGGKGDGKGVSPEINAQLQQLTRTTKTLEDQLKAERTAREKAEGAARETEKAAQIRAALGEFNFVNKSAGDDAFSLVAGKVEFDQDGKLVADGLPLGDYVKNWVSDKPYLLAPKGTSGAGAGAGTGNGGQRAGAFSMEQIKPGMSADDAKSAAAAIRAALT